ERGAKRLNKETAAGRPEDSTYNQGGSAGLSGLMNGNEATAGSHAMRTVLLSNRSWLILISGLCMGSVLATPSWSQTRPAGVSLATQDRVRNPGWWPTKGDAPRSAFLGPGACGECHAGKLQSQQQTPMAHAAAHAGDADVLRQHVSLEFLSGT